jgi:hypothetical protein
MLDSCVLLLTSAIFVADVCNLPISLTVQTGLTYSSVPIHHDLLATLVISCVSHVTCPNMASMSVAALHVIIIQYPGRLFPKTSGLASSTRTTSKLIKWWEKGI